jgi:hypothetical protein
MPNYILEAKKRLGMIKQPHIAPNIEHKKHQQTEQAPQPVIDTNSQSADTKISQKHWQMWDNPSTPDKIKEIRARLGDDRYRKLQRSKTSLSAYETKLDNYIKTSNNFNNSTQRPKTSFEIKTENAPQNVNSNLRVTTTVTVNENEAAALAQALEPYQIPTINDMETKSHVNTTVSYNPPMPTSGHLPLSAVGTNYFDLPNPSIIHTTATTLPPFSEQYDNYIQTYSNNQNATSNPEVSALRTVYDNDNFMVNNENQVISDRTNDDNENDYYTVVPNNDVIELTLNLIKCFEN